MQNFDHVIDKLFSQATFEPDRMVGGIYYPYFPLQVSGEPMRLSITQAQYHEFAKLIAAECVKLCEQNAEDVDNGDVFRTELDREKAYNYSWGAGSYECAELIRKQFGVTSHDEI
jgi:hypothetical protein